MAELCYVTNDLQNLLSPCPGNDSGKFRKEFFDFRMARHSDNIYREMFTFMDK